jgi:BirA family biotin operon repressor/biotin-[acetyl-CoA-carboxylase] ligase
MNLATTPECTLPTSLEPPLSVTVAGNWTVHEFARVTSTNLVAAKLPAWHAVRADVQTAGRGRFQRTWVSDAGGLWLSAVIPVRETGGRHALLPLLAGSAVCATLWDLGADKLRMRWPNDILAGEGKLAGVLMDQFVPGLVVVGIGLNVTNQPERFDAGLAGRVARLAGLVRQVPAPPALAVRILAQLEKAWVDFEAGGIERLLRRINELWRAPIPVELDLDGRLVHGQFEGVDRRGYLRLRTGAGQINFYEPHQVRLLREKPIP